MIVTGLLILSIVVSSLVYLNFQKPYTGNIEPITIGIYPSEYSSLIYIANDQQYFAANGLEVTLKEYPSGAAAVRGMLNGEVDVSTASEFVVANNALQNARFVCVWNCFKVPKLVFGCQNDRGINDISDIVGKRIGVPIGTANQFFLGRFLDLNSINQSQVTLVNVNFADTPNALANGTVDAAMTFQPYINQIQGLLGNTTVIWSAQADQFGYFEATCTKNWATTHPDLIVRFLKGYSSGRKSSI